MNSTLYDNGALLFDHRSWDVAWEFPPGTSDAVVRKAAAVSANGEHLLIHHCRTGTVNFRGLATSMARLLTGAVDLDGEEMDAAYDHLAAHYREIGIEPPEPGFMDEDRAYELALEGRLAHLDDDGDAWVFIDPVEEDGQTLARFSAVDNSDWKFCVAPAYGHIADPRYWGQMQPVESPHY